MASRAYYTDQELPGIPFEWRDYAGALIDFSSGWTFTANIVDPADNDIVTSQTTSIVGAATVPNVTLQKWTSATLTAVATDMGTATSKRYELRLYARRSSDSSDDVLMPGAPPVIMFEAAAT